MRRTRRTRIRTPNQGFQIAVEGNDGGLVSPISIMKRIREKLVYCAGEELLGKLVGQHTFTGLKLMRALGHCSGKRLPPHRHFLRLNNLKQLCQHSPQDYKIQ
jgi:hypothetical protein